jgi:hypothetical protein
MSLLHVHAACLCCTSLLLVRDACAFQSCMSKMHPCRFSMLHHAACPCNMYILHFHAAWPCCFSLLNVPATCPCQYYIPTASILAACPWACLLNVDKHFYAACPCCMPFCLSLPHVLAACPCHIYCQSILHVHAACMSMAHALAQ